MTKENLIKNLVSKHSLKSKHIIDAFENVDRANFVPKDKLEDAYQDHPLSIGYGQTISQPTTVAFMLELLDPEYGDKVLDVGSGSGWTTALLAYVVGEKGYVYGVERIPSLIKFGRENLIKNNVANAEIVEAEKDIGLSDRAPFNKILVSASSKNIPIELKDQLAVGGRMVIPIKDSVVEVNKVGEGEFTETDYYGFRFVPLISG